MGIASAAAAPPARKGGWMDMDGHSCQAGGLETRSRHGCLSLSLPSSVPLKRYFALYISLETAVTKEQMKPSSLFPRRLFYFRAEG